LKFVSKISNIIKNYVINFWEKKTYSINSKKFGYNKNFYYIKKIESIIN